MMEQGLDSRFSSTSFAVKKPSRLNLNPIGGQERGKEALESWKALDSTAGPTVAAARRSEHAHPSDRPQTWSHGRFRAS
jgi:hypothetical protein